MNEEFNEIDGFQLQRVGTHSSGASSQASMARLSFGGDGKYFEESVNVSALAWNAVASAEKPLIICAERSNQNPS